jgi:hypothetical protein
MLIYVYIGVSAVACAQVQAGVAGCALAAEYGGGGGGYDGECGNRWC